MGKPVVFYFPIRGRAEPIKLALAAKGIEFDVQPVDYELMKTDREQYPFAQCPRFVDADGLDLSQSNTIMRHVGRKYGLLGGSEADAARIDMVVDGVEDIKRKYLALIYQDQLSDEAKKAHWANHIAHDSMSGRNGGAHFGYLAGLVQRYGKDGWAVGGHISIADVLLFDIVDLHTRIYGEEFRAAWPALAALHDKVAAVPGVKAYLESPLRLEKVNNNNLG
ncbi:hypothetical protein COHA_003411 [Chlorella ohadii]|uniref:glutathione transferase n=1 Tax=Chlorella ohadii TaxID=2649997 RepID=A0AAD5H3G0_9CHLO|nr:hypothetical protein COHA_003411 [Chlorella ohadii]